MTLIKRTIFILTLSLLASTGAIAQSIRIEAETGVRSSGMTVATQRRGYSGTGYVTGIQKDGDRIVFKVKASAGLYNARIRFSAPNGEKGYELTVNGAKYSGMFPGTGDVFATQSAGKVELKAGTNTLTLEKGWGYYDVDYIELQPVAGATALRKPPPTLVDSKATPKARALLKSLLATYGTKMLSGQYDAQDNDYIRQVTGKTPAIFGSDLIEYSPSRVAHDSKPKGMTETTLARLKNGQILTLSWHWNAPKDLIDKTYKDKDGKTVDAQWYKGFYTYATTFDVQRALANPQSEDYRLLLRDIDVIAVELKKYAAADVPILWRPLHEAEGGWFWWGAKGPGPFVQLWKLLYDRLVNRHQLHNLIWVYTTGSKTEWYPGDAYVDVLGVDAYPGDVTDPLSNDWESLLKRYDGKKLLAITEFGGVPDVERMKRFGVRWAYFVSWTGDLGPKKISKDALKRIYQSAEVINLP